MVKAVIFDMDGVIIDSEPLMDSYFMDYFKRLDIKFDKSIQKSLRGVSSEYFWTKLKEIYNLPNPVDFYIQDVRYGFIEYLKSVNGIIPIDGVIDFIDSLKQTGIKTTLATSGSKLRMNTVLELINMQNCFEVMLSAQDVKNAKPDPEIFLLSAKLMEVKPGECVVIEDSANGVKAAKRAGMKCIGFKQAANDQDLAEADNIVNDFDEKLLSKILSL